MSHELAKKKNAMVGLYSSLLLIILAPVSVFVHETGHLIVCVSEGNTYTMDVNLLGGMLHCSQRTASDFVFLLFGGVFAMIVLSTPFIAWKKISKYPLIVIPLISLIIGHGVNAVVEAFLSNWYLENMAAATIIINAFVVVTFLVVWKKTNIPKLA